MEELKFRVNQLLAIPFLPLLYYQGSKVRRMAPTPVEPKDTKGHTAKNDKKPFYLLTIGESTIAGVGVTSHEKGFTGTLASELTRFLNVPVSWQVYAKSGYTARMVRSKIIPELKDTPADLVIVGLGGNDTFTLNSPKNWSSNINRLISSLRHLYPEVPIAFINMPPIRDFPAFTPLMRSFLGRHVELLNKSLAKTVSQYHNVYFISDRIKVEDWIRKYPELGIKTHSDLFSDGVHPSQFTYQIWAIETAKFLFNQVFKKKSHHS